MLSIVAHAGVLFLAAIWLLASSVGAAAPVEDNVPEREPSPVRVVERMPEDASATDAPPEALAMRVSPELREPLVVPEIPVPEPQSEEPPPLEEQRELPSVHQPAREEQAPEEANFLAAVDNRAEVETMAVETAREEAPEPEVAGEENDAAAEATSEASEVAASDGDDAETQRPEPRRGDPEGREAPREGADTEPREALAAVAPVAPSEPSVALPPVPDEAGASESVRAESSALDALRMDAAFARGREALEAQTLGSTPLGALGGHDEASYAEVFGGRDASDRERVARAASEASIAGDHEARWERTRASLENYDISVRPGRETNLNTRADVAASYIHHIHNKLHDRWRSYLSSLDVIGNDARLLDPDLSVTLEYVIRGDGRVEDVRIWRSSGVLTYDARAVDTFYAIGPHIAPPEGVRSADGLTYIHWQLYRDNRACGTFNASIRRVLPTEPNTPGRAG